jgi:hypothetical protein
MKMTPVIVHELYFVVRISELENLKELPRHGYTSLLEAMRAHDGREEFTVKSYIYVWNVVQRNIC